MSKNATGSGVAKGDLITFGTSITPGSGGNAWPWWQNTGSTTVSSVSTSPAPGSATLSASPTGAGVLQGDTIFAAPLYQIVPFSSDYRPCAAKSTTCTTLNNASNIVKVTKNNCLGTPGGLGTFYADAITAAQTALVAQQNLRIAAGQPAGTNVIILLSDGAATSTSAQMGPLETANVNQECHAAISAAQAAAKAGTWVYAIYYDDGSPDCSDIAEYHVLLDDAENRLQPVDLPEPRSDKVLLHRRHEIALPLILPVHQLK